MCCTAVVPAFLVVDLIAQPPLHTLDQLAVHVAVPLQLLECPQ